MAESATLDTPVQLRYLFVTMLMFCDTANPLALYQLTEAYMMEDFNQRLQDVDRARAAGLDGIVQLLRAHGKSLSDYGLPLPDVALLEEEPEDGVLGEIDAVVRWARQLENLNGKQRTVFDRVMAAVDDNRNVSKLFYVDGPGRTGIAASLMDGGMTVHSTFGLPFVVNHHHAVVPRSEDM
ncbi:ATP-dependent DNA helicase [Aphis craccivora]|uniref:ATP-dependent DNA helicase n=1 Tax=Aphis craccivora TaxID=307492 RepID=A0A6G0Y287_APHCR|nr:ATP-dependent DNA helicase [Aphis craccivora]